MTSGHDLTGRWHGIYNYPHSYPPTQFQAILVESGGLLSGTTSEPGEAWEAGTVAVASILGRRDGSSVRFSKVYDDDAVNDLWVEYHGLVSADGNEIEGNWSVPGEWSGTFLMVRQSGRGAEADKRVTAEIQSFRY